MSAEKQSFIEGLRVTVEQYDFWRRPVSAVSAAFINMGDSNWTGEYSEENPDGKDKEGVIHNPKKLLL